MFQVRLKFAPPRNCNILFLPIHQHSLLSLTWQPTVPLKSNIFHAFNTTLGKVTPPVKTQTSKKGHPKLCVAVKWLHRVISRCSKLKYSGREVKFFYFFFLFLVSLFKLSSLHLKLLPSGIVQIIQQRVFFLFEEIPFKYFTGSCCFMLLKRLISKHDI